MRRSVTGQLLLLALLLTALPVGAAPTAAPPHDDGGRHRPLIFFAADGLRQDLVQRYADKGSVRELRELLRTGASGADGGLLTQAPPNTGAGWYTLATGAWPGTHGSTNNTFHINGQPFANRTAAFDPGVLQAETVAQSAERAGRRVVQIEWAGGRSVLQLMVSNQGRRSDVVWAGGTTRVAKTIGVAPRPDVQAIVDAANAETAVLRNQVVGSQAADIRRAPTRLFESAMGNMVADAMRLKYPGVDAALTNSGGLRADLVCAPPSAGEAPCEITWGEMFAVLPFGNRTVILTLTGAQLTQALLNGFSPFCDPTIATGRFPQVSGLAMSFSCSGATPVVTGLWRAPDGPGGALTPIDPADTVRLVTNDFMLTGGDGYTAFAGATNVLEPGDALLDIAIEYVTANSPVSPAVEGRIVGP